LFDLNFGVKNGSIEFKGKNDKN
jgi:hypothetical protein